MLERDLKILSNKFEVEIKFNTNVKGFFLEEENNPNLRTFEHFAKTQVLSGILADMLNNGQKVWDVVDIDDQVPIMNLEHVKPLVEAMLDKRRVRITYLKFFQKEFDTYELEPHLIRQVMKRWYLIAGDSGTEDVTIKTFGLERIIKVEKTKTPYEPQTKEIKRRIRKVYGISQYNEEKESVVLETNRWQGKYLETLPIHPSQRVEYLLNDTCRVNLSVVINQEIIQLLASQTHAIKVIKPERLKTLYREFLEKKLDASE
jgi:predicted DNA-binding transcriptional regulator YafY